MRRVFTPSDSISVACAATRSLSRLLAMVAAPARAKPRAIAWPIPLVPPSTTATLFFRENFSSRKLMGVKGAVYQEDRVGCRPAEKMWGQAFLPAAALQRGARDRLGAWFRGPTASTRLPGLS